MALEVLNQAVAPVMLERAILNSLPAKVAVVSPHGAILATNNSWDSFAHENGLSAFSLIGTKANYLDACRRAFRSGDKDAKTALDGIQDVLHGRRTFFQLEYPCQSATR